MEGLMKLDGSVVFIGQSDGYVRSPSPLKKTQSTGKLELSPGRIDLVVALETWYSRSNLKRLIKQRAIDLNGVPIGNRNVDLSPGDVLKIGKKRQLIVGEVGKPTA